MSSSNNRKRSHDNSDDDYNNYKHARNKSYDRGDTYSNHSRYSSHGGEMGNDAHSKDTSRHSGYTHNRKDDYKSNNRTDDIGRDNNVKDGYKDRNIPEENRRSKHEKVTQAKKPVHGADSSINEDDDQSDEMSGNPPEGDEDFMKLFGFSDFDTTKGKTVYDNSHSAAVGKAAKNKGRQYRQYMNRRGGFNKPLAKMG